LAANLLRSFQFRRPAVGHLQGSHRRRHLRSGSSAGLLFLLRALSGSALRHRDRQFLPAENTRERRRRAALAFRAAGRDRDPRAKSLYEEKRAMGKNCDIDRGARAVKKTGEIQ